MNNTRIQVAPRRRKSPPWYSSWPVLVYRLHLGWMMGGQFMLVSHRGRQTGKLRQTGVMVLRHDRAARQVYVVAGSTAADWYRNIQAAPAEEIQVGRERYRPIQSFLSTAEVADLLEWSRKCHPLQARLQALFFGWPWKADRARLLTLAASFGGVAFRPANPT